MCVQVPLSELLRQLNGNRVVVHVAVAIVVPSVRAILKIIDYEFERHHINCRA